MSDIDFRVLAAKYILGECNNINVTGPEEKVNCIVSVLQESKKLYNALEETNPDLEKIILIANRKNFAAQNFKKITGRDWHF